MKGRSRGSARTAGAPRIFPVIMAGGSGTRFWPLSRRGRPKQLLPLASDKPLLVDTAERVAALSAKRDTLVVCGKVHAPSARRLLRGVPAGNVVVEPVARNTAPAIALACAHVSAKAPSGVLVVLPSDHHIRDVPAFQEALRQAAALAEKGLIVTIGIRPTRPDTGYGYIRGGAPLSGQARKVEAFVEKPDAETARRYLASGDYLWNAGIFVFRADVMLDAFRRHMPELTALLEPIRLAIGTGRYPRVLASAFPKMPSISIDYGVAEKADNIAVVPGDFGWSDVGSFNALPDVRQVDAHGNVVLGEGAIALGCEGCVVLAARRPLAVVGMKDVAVIDSGDALLVIPKEKSQDVRRVVEELERRGWRKFL